MARKEKVFVLQILAVTKMFCFQNHFRLAMSVSRFYYRNDNFILSNRHIYIPPLFSKSARYKNIDAHTFGISVCLLSDIYINV